MSIARVNIVTLYNRCAMKKYSAVVTIKFIFGYPGMICKIVFALDVSQMWCCIK